MALVAGDCVRKSFSRCKRCLIKVGSNVLTNDDGRLAIGRIGELVEQIAKLVAIDRKEVVLVSSGAVAVGSRRLSFQRRLSQTLLQTGQVQKPSPRAAASAGQAMFMSLYEQMFAQFDLTVGNVLVTHGDFTSQEHVSTLASTIDELLECGIIPVINENDVTNQILKDRPMWFKDNDSLSAKLASDFDAQLLLLLTDVPGVYTAAPGAKEAYLLDYYSPAIDQVKFGDKSSRGRGGMESKMHAALLASQKGVDVVIASGTERRIIDRIFNGEVLGTVFTNKWEQQWLTPRQICKRARDAVPIVQSKTGEQRTAMLRRVVKLLAENESRILDANAADLAAAANKAHRPSASEATALTKERIAALALRVQRLADMPDPIGDTLQLRRLTNGLTLRQQSVPLGVVLCVTNDVAEVFAQMAALALRTGNVLIVYDDGGSLRRTNNVFKEIFAQAAPQLPSETLQYCGTETDLRRLLNQREEFIDIVIPRGAERQLVAKLQAMTTVPVLGDGSATSHVYVDASADIDKAVEVVLDSKVESQGPGCTDSVPCLSETAADVLLVHEELVTDRRILRLVQALTDQKVALCGGPRAVSSLGLKAATELSSKWGEELAMTVEIVKSPQHAIEFINENGCGVADVVVAEDKSVADNFLRQVDTACAFHNTSTRFADGWRLGLGAETGVSTKRVHARGPVGVKGLLSTKWQVTSDACHTLKQHREGKWEFEHLDLPIDAPSAAAKPTATTA